MAPAKKIADFFTFCGKIERITLLHKSGEDSKQAFIVFGTEEAAQTALLLTNAHIVDRAVKVELVSEPSEPNSATPHSDSEAHANNSNTLKVVHGHEIEQKNHAVSDHERSKLSVIASLIAAGYVLGEDIIRRAKEYDEERMISLHLKVGAQLIKAKAQSIDQKYGISEKAAAVSQSAAALKDLTVQKMQEIDESLKISDKAASLAQTVGQTFSGLAALAMQNESIAKGITAIQDVGAAIKERVDKEKAEIEKAILEKQRLYQLERQQRELQRQQGGDGSPASAEKTTEQSDVPTPTPTEMAE